MPTLPPANDQGAGESIGGDIGILDAGKALVGWLVVCAVVAGGAASGLRSKEKSEPNGKCCTTGNLDKTSASYIFSMPYTLLAPT